MARSNSSLFSRIRSRIANLISPSIQTNVVPTVHRLTQPTSSTITPLRTYSSSSYPYDAGGSGRRSMGWQVSRLGPTTLLWGSLDQIRARSRDEIRNNPWGVAAIDNFESQVIGNGIRPRWNLEDQDLKLKIEKEFERWSKRCDFHGRSNFYGLQATAAREFFEAGEVFSRYHPRPASWMKPKNGKPGLNVPLQIQLLESEQLPVFRNVAPTEAGVANMPPENSIRTGIEFDPDGRRVAYHFYKEHPGETMFFPLEGLTFTRIPADDILHVYKPERAGLLRGSPRLTSVLTLLYEIDQYTDAELARKKIQAMFAGFIEKPAPDSDILPIDPDNQVSSTQPNSVSSQILPQDIGTAVAKIESGTMQELLPGEKITFPQLPADQTIEQFLRAMLHRFAIGVGATYEQVTGDLKGVNYSSIRAGLLDFRRKCEQLQRNIFIFQFCQPLIERWLYEAWLAGTLELPGYAADPEKYYDVLWATPGWDWVDPQKDTEATIAAIRAGLTTRAHEVAELGKDVAAVDREQAADNKRADELKLVYDSRADQVLMRGAKNPQDPGLTDTEAEKENQEVEEETAPAVPAAPSSPPPAKKKAARTLNPNGLLQ